MARPNKSPLKSLNHAYAAQLPALRLVAQQQHMSQVFSYNSMCVCRYMGMTSAVQPRSPALRIRTSTSLPVAQKRR